MDGSIPMNESPDAPAIFAPLWRRKWLILAVALVAAGGTYLYYKRSARVFQASTQLYLGAGAEEQAGGEKKSTSPDVTAQNAIINSIVVEKVRKRLRSEHNQAAARGTVRTKPTEKGGLFITITTEAHKPRAAATLANLVAQTYIERQRENHQRGILTSIAIARRQLRRIELANAGTPKGKSRSAGPSASSVLQEASLNSKINQLEAQLATAGAQQLKPAKPGNTTQIAPKPKKNAIFGFVIGLLLASVAAYLLERLDRRLRSLDRVEPVLGAPILAALPAARRPIVLREGRPSPSRFLLEPLRRLHTTLKLTEPIAQERAGSPRVLLFLSPDAGDGKSTLVANLALVQSDAGERVAVVEGNLRRPVMAKLLNVPGSFGLVDVLTGAQTVDEAMQTVQGSRAADAEQQGGADASVATVVRSRSIGSLSVLTSGQEAANPPALLAGAPMADLLRGLADDYDSVLIDVPSPLEVSDAMPLLPVVDAIVLVARMGHTRETSAQKLVQLLTRVSSAPVLGVAVNCASQRDLEQYGFAAPHARVGRGKLTPR
jgi:Mrp family chromosome partitioning ATPase